MRSIAKIMTTASQLWPLYLAVVIGAVATSATALLTPFVIARETHGERAVPAWLEARPNRMRILVHQLPVREQIAIDVAEQMIVELYSK